ncbi:anti-anti-sigma factor [[Phormidium ambiguum] IAM M-71]|uniref:Anti-sigma factor antagonist n=1 Tax=[Phormidium ambiguum] IAM M-71 TaxID=454136 RepID=A0A1U7IQL8_9CYAN|nr:anti-sigma factor antagonist [Phormidium ambiguum]OKH39710.1 anti-anti-sigma factor [Phormidium ambiguum IAM M-71]
MYCEVIVLKETTLIQVPPRLTVLEAVEFRKTCHELCQSDNPPSKIVFDFSNTTFMDSSGLGALVSNFKLTKDRGIEIVLRDVRPQVMAVLSLTGLNAVLPIEQTKVETEKVTNKNEIVPPPTHPSIYSWIKRSLDIVGAIVGLGITVILFLPIAIAIKLDSPGPILFGQIRCGWMGKKFRMWKFRSMCANAEQMKSQVENQLAGPLFKNDNDPRITKVGRFLRKTSLDEIPQFWNVLIGEMSLVGTRPPTPDEVEKYDVPEWQRLDVKPGMTGEWQVNGRSQIKNFEDVIRLDLKYQQNWSLMYDLKLIFKTIFIVFNRNSGAY